MQPRWSDLDLNQHVNNVRYIGWILEVKTILLFMHILCCSVYVRIIMTGSLRLTNWSLQCI